MRRWFALVLVALLLIPSSALSTGSLTIPNNLFSQPTGNLQASLLDANWTAIATYVNAREATVGLLAARPAAGTSGRWYIATDQNGGTTFLDTGSAWIQVAGPVTSQIAQQLTGLTLANNGTATATFTIAAGAATSDDSVIANRILMVLTAGLTKSLAAWAVGTGGCLDTGAVAVFTWYSVFLIERTDTGVVDVLCSTSATAPTKPTNYTKQRRIGSIRTDWSTPAGSMYFFTQTGDYYRWATASVALDVNTGASGIVAVTATLSTPNGVQTLAQLQIGSGSGGAASVTYVSELTATDEAAGTGTGFGQAGSTAAATSFGEARVMTDAASSVRRRSSGNSTLTIITPGYWDRRGQQ